MSSRNQYLSGLLFVMPSARFTRSLDDGRAFKLASRVRDHGWSQGQAGGNIRRLLNDGDY